MTREEKIDVIIREAYRSHAACYGRQHTRRYFTRMIEGGFEYDAKATLRAVRWEWHRNEYLARGRRRA